jgi:NAD-dependent dihydropyrimidine dehydrogenase PreA subunit
VQHKYLKNVTTLSLSREKCTGCGKCTDVCPHGVFAVENGKAEIIDKNSCMECGACAKNCPLSVIAVEEGVGCALAVIYGWLSGKEPTCGCAADECC